MTNDEPENGSDWVDEGIKLLGPPIVVSPPAPRIRWGMGLGLFAFSLMGSAAIIPFSISLMRQMKDSIFTPAMMPLIAIGTIVIEGVFALVAIMLGLGLGRRTGLGPLMLEGLDGNSMLEEIYTAETTGPPRYRALKSIGIGLGLGALLGVLFLGFSYSLAPSMPERETKIVMPPMWECLLASVGAGIREEVWLRLGVMTLFAWLGMVIARCRPGNSTAIWLGNVLSALVFGAIHLPQAAGLFGLNAGIVVFVLLGNGLPGVVFGWLFWRKGLIAAMASHFMFDIVLKVIAPALMG